MVAINQNIYQARANIAKALGHWIRIKIIQILDSKGDHCVCELIDLIDASQSTISKHLKVLKEAASRTMDAIPRLELDRYKGVFLAPLSEINYKPDVIVIE